MLDELGVVASHVWRRNAPLVAGIGLAIVAFSMLKKPLRSLAVATARGALDVSDRVTSAAGSIKQEVSTIVEEAREEVKADAAKRKAVEVVPDNEQTLAMADNHHNQEASESDL
ncbi:MAG: hypothetical protein HPY50_08875 [Firmicutes bacterium]|nr:hypothetical protein [Bacillota bacterium]